MAKEFVVWCDPCLTESDQRTPSQTYIVGLGNKEPLGIDLCAEHYLTFIEPLAALLKKNGVKQNELVTTPVEAPTRKRNFPCLACPETFTTNYAFVRHLADKHNMIPTEMFGEQCPVCGVAYKGGAGMGSHIARHHPEVGQTTAEVFVEMAKRGDPHGVVVGRQRLFHAEPDVDLVDEPDADPDRLGQDSYFAPELNPAPDPDGPGQTHYDKRGNDPYEVEVTPKPKLKPKTKQPKTDPKIAAKISKAKKIPAVTGDTKKRAKK